MTISHKLEDKKQSFLNIFWKKKNTLKILKFYYVLLIRETAKT